MDKQAIIAQHLPLGTATKLWLHPGAPAYRDMDFQLAKHLGLQVGPQLGAGMQGGVFRLERAPYHKPEIDPGKHVIKLLNVHPDDPRGLVPGLEWWNHKPEPPARSSALLVPEHRIEVPSTPMTSSGGLPGTLVGDVNLRSDKPGRVGAMLPHVKQRVGRALMRQMLDEGHFHEDMKPDNMMWFRGLHGGPAAATTRHGAFRISDLGGLRRLAPHEQGAMRSDLIDRMMRKDPTSWGPHELGMVGKIDPGLLAAGHKNKYAARCEKGSFMTPYQSYMAKLASDLPFSVDHPYENEFESTAGGAIMGAVGTAGAMAAAQAAADPLARAAREARPNLVRRLLGEKNVKAVQQAKKPELIEKGVKALLGKDPSLLGQLATKIAPLARDAKALGVVGLAGGALGGAALGALGGKAKTLTQHYHDAREYEEESGEELSPAVRHPYIMRDIASVPGMAASMAMGGKFPRGAAAMAMANRALTQAGSTLYHHHEKQQD